MEAKAPKTPPVAYAGIAAIILQWLTLISFVVLDFEFAGQLKPISYFATRPTTQQIFTVGFAVSGILVWAFIALWARRFIKISVIIFTISMGLFIAMATIPFRPEDIQNLIQHEYITALFALTYVIGMLHVGVRNRDSGIRFVSFVCGTIGLAFGIITWNTNNSVYPTTIIFYEIICALAAQYWVLYLSRHFLATKKNPQ